MGCNGIPPASPTGRKRSASEDPRGLAEDAPAAKRARETPPEPMGTGAGAGPSTLGSAFYYSTLDQFPLTPSTPVRLAVGSSPLEAGDQPMFTMTWYKGGGVLVSPASTATMRQASEGEASASASASAASHGTPHSLCPSDAARCGVSDDTASVRWGSASDDGVVLPPIGSVPGGAGAGGWAWRARADARLSRVSPSPPRGGFHARSPSDPAPTVGGTAAAAVRLSAPRRRTRLLEFPADVMECVCGYLRVPTLIRLQQTCRGLRRGLPKAIARLDLSDYELCVLPTHVLARWASQGMALRTLVLPNGLEEKYTGVLGFILRASKHRLAKVHAGTAAASSRVLAEILLAGENALTMFRHASPGVELDTEPPNARALAALLVKSPHLAHVVLGSSFAPEVPCFDDDLGVGADHRLYALAPTLSQLIYPHHPGGASSSAPPPPRRLRHASLQHLSLYDVTTGMFDAATTNVVFDLPSLVQLGVFERQKPMAEVPAAAAALPTFARLGVLDLARAAPNLQVLEAVLAAPVPLQTADLRGLVAAAPQLRALVLRTRRRRAKFAAAQSVWTDAETDVEDNDASENGSGVDPPALTTAGLATLLTNLPELRTLCIEDKGWGESHWTRYCRLGKDRTPKGCSLVLQSGAAELPEVMQRVIPAAPGNNFFEALQSVVLYGAMGNAPVHSVLRHCPRLERLEVYLLKGSTADDELLAWGGVSPTPPCPRLRVLHVHDASNASGVGQLLTPLVLVKGGALGEMFPNLQRVGVLGLSKMHEAYYHESPMATAVDLLQRGLPRSVTRLCVGPLVHTSSALLSLVAATTTRLRLLALLEIAWCFGEVPRKDDNAMNVLGLETLERIVHEVNPRLQVKDVSRWHFPSTSGGRRGGE